MLLYLNNTGTFNFYTIDNEIYDEDSLDSMTILESNLDLYLINGQYSSNFNEII